jgi:hypothetical protein
MKWIISRARSRNKIWYCHTRQIQTYTQAHTHNFISTLLHGRYVTVNIHCPSPYIPPLIFSLSHLSISLSLFSFRLLKSCLHKAEVLSDNTSIRATFTHAGKNSDRKHARDKRSDARRNFSPIKRAHFRDRQHWCCIWTIVSRNISAAAAATREIAIDAGAQAGNTISKGTDGELASKAGRTIFNGTDSQLAFKPQ